MPVDSVTSLIELLRRFELLSTAQLDELKRDSSSETDDPRTLAEGLVQRGWLTSFQVKRLFQDRAKDLVLGNYVLLDQLGQGGMGQVYKARHRRMGRIVAVKVIARGQVSNPSAVSRFQREIEAAAQLEHPHVVRAYDADKAGDVHFFVMEYVEGIDLGKLVQRDGPLPVEQACDYIRQAALGLQHAHERGLVHRDIKPANLLLATRENVVKVLDLGLARLDPLGEGAAGSPALTRDGALMGTPDFIAPEQARDAHTADIRADLYSLGCTFYFLLTGQVPFPGGSLTQKLLKQQLESPAPLEQLRPDVSSLVAAVVHRLMAKDPRDRYQSPAEAALALTRLAQGATLDTSSGTEKAALVPSLPFNTRCLRDTLSESEKPTPLSDTPRALPSASSEDLANAFPNPATPPPGRLPSRRILVLVAGGILLLALSVLLAGKLRPSLPDTSNGGNSEPLVPESPEQAIAAFRQCGAEITLASHNPDAPVVRLDGTGSSIRDADLAHLRALPKLEQLFLYETAVSDAGLAHLNGLTSLRLLGLSKTRITDAGLANLRDLTQLQVLWLGETEITDAGVAELAALTQLRRLNLGGTRITDGGLQRLHPLRQLRTLDLSHTKVSEEAIQKLQVALPALKVLR
jgi:serine/threonine protein kinase